MNRLQWIILTGEYPPQPGGVSDYTRLIAGALAAAGDEVHVWAPRFAGHIEIEPGVAVHRLPDHFGSSGLAELTRTLDAVPEETRLLVQYVPHAFGRKAMNLQFCLWLFKQRRRLNVVVMFHEVAYPWVRRERFVRQNFLAAVNRLMVFLVARSAERLLVSIPAWAKMLRPYVGDREIEWLPVPSNMPQVVDRQRVAEVRRHLMSGADARLVGHFGTFGGHIVEALHHLIPETLTLESRVSVLLVGRGGQEFAAELKRSQPHLAHRVIATGSVRPDAVSHYLSACDLLIQPYPDGISSRRTSAMAGLACGAPILTTKGHLTEPLWEESGAVSLVASFRDMAKQASNLLANDAERIRLSYAAVKLYQKYFHLDRVIDAMRSGVRLSADTHYASVSS